MIGSEKPFFSDDTTGLLRLAGTFLAGVITVTGGAWAMFNSAITRRVTVLEKRLDSSGDTGKEIEITKARRSEIDSRLNQLEAARLLMDANLRGLDASYTTVTDRLEALMERIDSRDERIAETLSKLGERMAGLEGAIRGGDFQSRRRDTDNK